MAVDYTLYLVTDSTKALLGERSLIDVVRQALCEGVTVVQYRDKTSDTRTLVAIAEQLHKLTKEFNVPLIINDRVDVALAVGAEGVHIGQDDMELAVARRLMGPTSIVGVSCSNMNEAQKAVAGGASYIGIGAVFATQTKTDTKNVLGISGVRAILERLSALADSNKKVATVAIGGINASNVQRVLFQSRATFKGLDGVAVVSGIIGATEPDKATRELRNLMAKPPPFYTMVNSKGNNPMELVCKIPAIVKKLGEKGVLCHNMINQVVTNFAANVALAVGARPIMANDGDEAEDLAQLGGCLVINMGTAVGATVTNYLRALQAYNRHGGPVLFDPVGAGATKLRRDAVQRLMNGGYFSIIKGNESEIKVVYGSSTTQQKGVDSGDSNMSDLEKARLVKRLAARERNVVVMTGQVDYISDGDRTYAIKNGDAYLGRITGTGCTLGTTIAAFSAVEQEDKLLGALSGLLMFEIASEFAADRHDVRGSGTFVPAFLDELERINMQTKSGDNSWLDRARIEIVTT